MHVTIRQATAADVEQIAGLILTVQELHVAARPDIFKPMQVTDALIAEIVGRLSAPGEVYFVAEVDGELVGYVYLILRERPENLYTYAMRLVVVDQIAVAPQYRSKGCGEALMQQVSAWGKQQQADRIALSVWSFNERAAAFYQRLGFSVFLQQVELTL